MNHMEADWFGGLKGILLGNPAKKKVHNFLSKYAEEVSAKTALNKSLVKVTENPL